jgi:hypothetical protein
VKGYVRRADHEAALGEAHAELRHAISRVAKLHETLRQARDDRDALRVRVSQHERAWTLLLTLAAQATGYDDIRRVLTR